VLPWFIEMEIPSRAFSHVINCRGARVAERRLLEEIGGQLASGADVLTPPVRVVVPSRSLRHHLLRVVARQRRSVAGLNVQTLYGLAMEVLAGTEAERRTGDAGFEVVVRRLAAVQPSLRSALGQLVDGYDAVVGAVRDLLDAGFQPGNEEGVIERLDEVAEEVASERIERARALVRLGSEVLGDSDRLGVWRPTHALQLAEDRIRALGPEALPTRALFIHGFADVTGVAADLLVALVQIHRGVVILDRPPDPVESPREDAGSVFLSRIEERLAHLDQVEETGAYGPPEIRLAEASDVESEARWVADRIRTLIEAGVEPEAIGVVSRGLEGLLLPCRRHFRRLGIPFSGCGATVPGAGLRRILNRLADLLRAAGEADVDLWIEARGDAQRRTELLLGLRVLGLLRVTDVARLGLDGVPAAGVTLPVAVSAEEEESDGDCRERRVLPTKALESAAADAARLLKSFSQWPDAADPGVHRKHTMGVLDVLGWSTDAPERESVRTCLDDLSRELPSDFEITRPEWLKLVADRLSSAGKVAVGGRGAGVQLLSVMEARARTFETLFIAGVNRGVFPRVVHEDPMLPEAVRFRLAADVLPEMPVKGRSADEERYLFAQLLSSAPEVHLSWHLYGTDGTLTPSPFVDRLRLREGIAAPESAPQLWPVEDAVPRPRPAYELAVLAAPKVDRDGFEKILAAAISENLVGERESPAWSTVEELAAARADALAAAEPPPGSGVPGPWFGFTGSFGRYADDPMWVTRLEATGTCPWRAFIEQRLGIYPLPDPRLGLPGVDGMLVGQVVHAVLEKIVLDAISDPPTDLDRAIAGAPVEVPWPSLARFDELVQREARRVAFREGLATIGMAPLLEARARQFLDVAHGVEWKGENALAGVLAPEVEGAVAIDGVARPLAFRADRVDLAECGPELVDYKAARPFSTAATDTTRASHVLARVARGRLLQAAAYAGAAGASGGRGRYLYLKPDDRWGGEVRNVVIRGNDKDVVERFETAVRAIADGRARGIAFPRLEEADGKNAEHCRYCRVAEACRRDDSGFRRRLVDWMHRESTGDHPDEESARALWWLGFDREGGDE
jgi:hypothetical protein